MTKLFAHSLHTELFKGAVSVGAWRGLDSRALTLASRDDIVACLEEPDSAYVAYLLDLGLGTDRILVPNPVKATLVENLRADSGAMALLREKKPVLHPYVCTQTERELATRYGGSIHGGDPVLATRLNNKAEINQLMTEIGVRVIPTNITEKALLPQVIKQVRDVHYEVLVRANASVGGSGVWPIRSDHDLDRCYQSVQATSHGTKFLVQPLLPVSSSPNIQYDLVESGAELLGVTEQRLEGNLRHLGNLRPAGHFSDCVLKMSDTVANYLHRHGYRGVIGFDFIVTPAGDAFLVEVNARINSSTFALHLDKVFRSIASGTKFFSTNHIFIPDGHTFQTVRERLGDLLFRLEGAGAIPVGVPVPGKSLEFVYFAHSRQEARQLEASCASALAPSRKSSGATA